MATITISIDRTALSLSPLVMDGNADGTSGLAVANYTDPALQARIQYAPSSLEQHGDLALGWTWQQTILGFDVFPDDQASEAAAQALVDELRDAITQALEFDVTVTKGGSVEVWTCNPGSLVPVGGRTVANLEEHDAVWTVTLPCFPVRG